MPSLFRSAGGTSGSLMRPTSLRVRPIDDREAVEVGDLREHPLGRAVGIGFEAEHAHAALEVNRPDRLVGLRVDDRRDVAAGGAGDHELAVGRDDGVVHAAQDPDELDLLQLHRVDDVNPAIRRLQWRRTPCCRPS